MVDPKKVRKFLQSYDLNGEDEGLSDTTSKSSSCHALSSGLGLPDGTVGVAGIPIFP
jgi:hypothetical protein